MKLSDFTDNLFESLDEAGLRQSALTGYNRPTSTFKTPPGAMIPSDGVLFLYTEDRTWLLLTHDKPPQPVGASVALQLHKIWSEEFAAESLGEAGPRTGKSQAASQARAKQRTAPQRQAPQRQAQQPAQPAVQAPTADMMSSHPPPLGATLPANELGVTLTYFGDDKGGWYSVEPGKTPEQYEPSLQVGLTRDYWKSQEPQNPQDPTAAPAAGPQRIPTGTAGTLYGVRYVYNSEQNRWIDQRNNTPARGLAHRKLMKSFRADDYGVVKAPSMSSRLSTRLGGPFGQGIDPDAGLAQKAFGTLGSMIGRGVGAAVRPRAATAPAPAPAPTATPTNAKAPAK